MSQIDRSRATLDQVLKDKETLFRSARVSFQQFDSDRSGTLDNAEIYKLVERLCVNLAIPPVDPETLGRVATRYDRDGDGGLELEEFAAMYWDLLLRIRDRFYPNKSIKVKRSFFVGRTNLQKSKRKITDVFTFKKHLGSGSFGAAHLVIEISSNMERVCKTIQKKNASLPAEQIEAEIAFMKSLDHPNIIKIYEVYEDYTNLYIIMEPCKGGELKDLVEMSQKSRRHLSERLVAKLARDLFAALAYIHEKNIAHKDLKPENVMFHAKGHYDSLKIIDFGVAEMFAEEGERSRNAAGTALYMAPEVFQRNFGLKCDIWSCGVILYQLLTGKLPYEARSLQEIIRKQQTTQPNYGRDCKHLSPEGTDLLRMTLQKDPRHRLSAKEALHHRWLERAPDTTVQLPDDVSDQIKGYMKKSELQKALVNLLAHQLPITGSQVKNITRMFRTLDHDTSGMISFEDLTKGLTSSGWQPWEINKLIQALDVDSSGRIDYTEFLAACYVWQGNEMDLVWTAFQKFDSDGDGVIDSKEFAKILLGSDRKIGTREEIENMLSEVDRNGDGKIDWHEFQLYWES